MSDEDTERLGSQAAVDKLVGRAKEIVGDTVGSESLSAKGRLQQAEGEAKREAAHHQVEAEVQRLQAREAVNEGTKDAAAQRAEAIREEQARKAQLERERLQAHAAAEAATAPREAAVERAGAAKESLIDSRERLARAERHDDLEVVEELEAQAQRSEDNARERERLQQDVQ